MMPETMFGPCRPHQNSSDMSSTMMMAPAQLSVRPCIGVWMILKMSSVSETPPKTWHTW